MSGSSSKKSKELPVFDNCINSRVEGSDSLENSFFVIKFFLLEKGRE
jgi:hypothetical protein